MTGTHQYAARLTWNGNTGAGTYDYRSYGRNFEIMLDGKKPIEGSADPRFLGDADRPNPEDLLISALSACHMLTYLALCAREGVQVEAYEDHATAVMKLTEDGGGVFVEASLFPSIQITDGSSMEKAKQLHKTAHGLCFIARSVRFPVRVDPRITLTRKPRMQGGE